MPFPRQLPPFNTLLSRHLSRASEEVLAPLANQTRTNPEPAPTSTQPGPTSPEPALASRFESAGSGSFNQPTFEVSAFCQATTRSGRECSAPPRARRPFCIFHDPDYAEVQRRNSSAAGQASGQSRRRTAAEAVVPLDLSTARSRADFLGYLVGATLMGRMPLAQARALQKSVELAKREDLPDPPSDLARELAFRIGAGEHDIMPEGFALQAQRRIPGDTA